MRIVVELKKGENPEVVLNQLYKHTYLQMTFGVIMLAIKDGKPEILNLKQLNKCYIDHRFDVITRRTKYELKKAQERAHILEGYKIALANLDEVIETIKRSKTPDIAKIALTEKFEMSEIQALAVLRLQLQRLTGLEIEKIEKEYQEILGLIKRLKEILANKAEVLKIIKNDLVELISNYGDERKTDIVENLGEFRMEDLISDDEMVLTISHKGYIKRTSADTYKAQKRGGKGLFGMETNDDDFVEHMFTATAHNYILFFTSNGQVQWQKVYDIPEGGRRSKGKAIVNLFELEENEKVTAFIPVPEFSENLNLLMLTKNGMIKKTDLMAYSRPRKGGIRGITLKENDSLIDVKLSDGESQIVIATKDGQAIRFEENKVRSVGRTSIGVRGIRLAKNDSVVGMVVVKENASILSCTKNGYGKRTNLSEYRLTNRGGKGVINIKTSERNGEVNAILSVTDEDQIMLITKNGIIIRQKLELLREIGRNTQGVRLIKLNGDDMVIDVAKVIENDEENSDIENEIDENNEENKETVNNENENSEENSTENIKENEE
jgi:DNA gyrase subunit A